MINYFTEEQMATTRTRYTLNGTNKKGETLIIEMYECYNSGKSYDIHKLWHKHGYTSEELQSHISVDVTVITDTGAWGYCNPTRIEGENKINFDWILEVSDENKAHLLNEIYKRFVTR